MDTIDVTPTWGEVGLLHHRLVMSKELKALQMMHPEVAKAFALAQAYTAIAKRLPDELRTEAKQIVAVELKKQGIE